MQRKKLKIFLRFKSIHMLNLKFDLIEQLIEQQL